MSITIDINVDPIKRFSTGLWSLDRALGMPGEYGMPLGFIVEMYGKYEVGKTTLSLYLAGRAQEDGRIVVADLEGSVRPDYATEVLERAGFRGTLQVVDIRAKGKMRSDESVIEQAADALLEDDVSATILDSIGSFTPIMERTGDIGEAFMGRRAKAIAQYVRRTSSWLRMTDFTKTAFLVNHMHQVMGGRGVVTPGGVTKDYLSRVRMKMWRTGSANKPNYNDEDGYLVNITIDKLTFGGSHRERLGRVFLSRSHGVLPGMTHVFDAIAEGLVERTPQGIKAPFLVKGEEVTKNIGRIKTLISDEVKGKMDRFKQIYRLLEGVE